MKNLPRVPVVYLAGGMRSNWQDKVIKAFPGVLFIDPRAHGSRDEKVYTAWDLTGVQLSDIVFGFIEKDNPNGGGLALEFGAAAALGKQLVYVEEPDFGFSRYFGMVRSVSDATFTSLEEGLTCLARLCGFVSQQTADGVPAFTAEHGVPTLCLPAS